MEEDVHIFRNFIFSNSAKMDVQKMQQNLIKQITAVNDEDILRMLDEELSFSLQGHTDLSVLLTDADHKELTFLSKEPVEKNTMPLSEFNNIMDRWRMK